MRRKTLTLTFADVTTFIGVAGVRGLNTARIRSLTEFQIDRNPPNEIRKAISIKQLEMFQLEDFVDTDEIEEAVNLKQEFLDKLVITKMELREIKDSLRRLDHAINRNNQFMSEIQHNIHNQLEQLE